MFNVDVTFKVPQLSITLIPKHLSRLINDRANYYELGGAKRRHHWKIWCKQVQRLLARKVNGSSLSETTAASSSSSSALYLLSSELEVEDNCDARSTKPTFRYDLIARGLVTVSLTLLIDDTIRVKNSKSGIVFLLWTNLQKQRIVSHMFINKYRIWTRYGGAGDYVAPTWTEKDLYLGPSFNELVDGHYTPVPIRFAGASLEDLKYELKDYTPYRISCKRSCQSWPCQTKLSRWQSQRASGLCNVLFARNHKARRCGNIASCKSSPCNVCELDDSVGIRKHCQCHGKSGMCLQDFFICI